MPTASPRSTLRDDIRRYLQLGVEAAPNAIQVGEREREDGYTRRAISYSVDDGDTIDALLFEPLVPNPVGAVLALHQHNSEWSIGKSEIAGLVGDPLQAFGPALARRGITVLSPDAVGFESRQGKPGAAGTLPPPI